MESLIEFFGCKKQITSKYVYSLPIYNNEIVIRLREHLKFQEILYLLLDEFMDKSKFGSAFIVYIFRFTNEKDYKQALEYFDIILKQSHLFLNT